MGEVLTNFGKLRDLGSGPFGKLRDPRLGVAAPVEAPPGESISTL